MVLKDREPAGQIRNSFQPAQKIFRGPDGNAAFGEMIKVLIQREVFLLRYVIFHADQYEGIFTKQKNGVPLSPNETQRLAAIETIGLILNPIPIVPDETNDILNLTYRRTFFWKRKIEALKHLTLSGNSWLHIASGPPWLEAYGISANVEITDFAGFIDLSEKLLATEPTEWNSFLKTHHDQIRTSTRVNFNSAEHTAFDPTTHAFLDFKLLNFLKHPFKLNFFPQTLSQFLENQTGVFDFIVWRRAEPDILFGDDINATLFFERFTKQFKTYAIDQKTALLAKKFSLENQKYSAEILAKILTRVKVGGQLYLSVGVGNNRAEMHKRNALLAIIMEICDQLKTPYTITSAAEFENIGSGDGLYEDSRLLEMAALVITRPEELTDEKLLKLQNKKQEKEFSRAKRNDPCPCQSGKKFKKCHGK